MQPADNIIITNQAGCNGDPNGRVRVTDAEGKEDNEGGNQQPVRPCFDHRSMPSLLDNHVSWKYFTKSGADWPISIWTAPNSLVDICRFDGTKCNSDDWNNKVEPRRAQILKDIQNCNLPQVSWVIPNGRSSDHPGMPDFDVNDSNQIEHGPAWVAAIFDLGFFAERSPTPPSPLQLVSRCPRVYTPFAQDSWI